ncbi:MULTISPECIES: hypothetical protein [Actinoalloteichus]|uniref:Uncharacterized protein n=1 Tax=Actinoalloteichus fjordicus TaxID=1612552 RepID=A0AAC9L868_9PSEU|nr:MULTISPECIES: hypothetical protein [Actinoalloteichus]APU12867.1 hypothetical protein UA74_03940 [Actinoalloteichus fjordicus]APU18839.1 hypothetical protein UA75_04040 [Actinoalloteichus sp. GBA129-24]
MRPEWFVRSVRQGDTHHGVVEQCGGTVVVRPACGGESFTALNRWPIHEFYYDDQECPDCLGSSLRPRLVLVAAS